MDLSGWIFVFSNVLFLFISLVFLISFLENRDKIKTRKAMPKTLPFVSIVIPAFDESDTIEGCLEKVARLNYPSGKMEVIVVNDGSNDDTLEKAGAKAKELEKRTGIKIKIVSQENRGKASALNRGISLAEGKLVATIDADSHPDENALRKMIPFFADEKVGAVTASVKVGAPKSFLQFLQYVEYLSMNYTRKTAAFLNGIHCTPGPLSIFSRKALKKTGGFDEGNAAEDTEMALHLQEEGFRIENAFDALVWSESPYSIRGLLRQRIRWYYGAVYNARKYSHMFFNRKFGNLGWFTLPANFTAVLFAIFVLARIFMDIGGKIAAIAWGFANSFFFGYAVPSVSFDLNPLYWLNVEIILVAFYIIVVMLGLRYSFKAAGEEFKITHTPVYFGFLLLYSFIITISWGAGIAKWALNKKPAW